MRLRHVAWVSVLLAAAFSVAGCLHAPDYYRTGATGSDLARDDWDCRRHVAAMQGPMAPYTSGFGASSPGPSPPNGEALFRSREDQAEGMRSCLGGHGW